MIVKPQFAKSLVGVVDDKIVKVPASVLRKPPLDPRRVEKVLTKPSVCIVCDFSFKEKNIVWPSNIKAVCHPFRKGIVKPTGSIDEYLLSESDFCDEMITITRAKSKKWQRYDFVYFTLLSTKGIRCKGLYLMPLISSVAKSLGIQGLVINYAMNDHNKFKNRACKTGLKMVLRKWKCYDNLKTISRCFSPQQVCDIMKSCKFTLFPNTADASPRLIVESLVRGTPIVVNSKIYGGWKYVNSDTGRFFDAPSLKEVIQKDVSSVYRESLAKAMTEAMLIDRSKVAETFYKDYGFVNTSKRLAQIINKFLKTDYKMVTFKEWSGVLKRILRDESSI